MGEGQFLIREQSSFLTALFAAVTDFIFSLVLCVIKEFGGVFFFELYFSFLNINEYKNTSLGWVTTFLMQHMRNHP